MKSLDKNTDGGHVVIDKKTSKLTDRYQKAMKKLVSIFWKNRKFLQKVLGKLFSPTIYKKTVENEFLNDDSLQQLLGKVDQLNKEMESVNFETGGPQKMIERVEVESLLLTALSRFLEKHSDLKVDEEKFKIYK